MSAFHKEEGIYGKAEARICLNCDKKKCSGVCERLKREKKKIKKKKVVK